MTEFSVRGNADIELARAPQSGAQSDPPYDLLRRRAPDLSAHAGVSAPQRRLMLVLSMLLLLAFLLAPGLAGGAAVFAAITLFLILIALRWAAACMPQDSLVAALIPDLQPAYTILCPAFREAAALPGLIEALNAVVYPRALLDVIILVEQDDPETSAVASAAARAYPWVRVIAAPAEGPRTKPKALNIGLAHARGDLLVVFDAEDRPHPQQLSAAAAAFAQGGARLVCVQAPLCAYNGQESWIAGQFDLEYAVQFRRLLPLFVKLGWPILLGGTSNHFRAGALRESFGWDAYNVTEDADLGLRLARAGYRTGIIAPPTWEEAPISLRAWRRQRTRWIKGHLMTWLVHMRRPTAMRCELGVWGFAGAHITLGGGLVSSFAHGPLFLWALWSLIQGDSLGLAWILALAGYAGAFACALRVAIERRQARLLIACLMAPLYWPLQSWAAAIALAEVFIKPHSWTKTEHGLTKARF